MYIPKLCGCDAMREASIFNVRCTSK
jgi:hypothetical protein